jgi:hypothetical protein
MTQGPLDLEQVSGLRFATRSGKTFGAGRDAGKHVIDGGGQGTQLGVFSLHPTSVAQRSATGSRGAGTGR